MKLISMQIGNKIYKVKDGWIDYSDYTIILSIKTWLKL